METVARSERLPGWGWRLVTVAVPPGETVATDVADLCGRLWRRWWRRVSDAVYRDTGHRPKYIRGLEVTAGRTRDGHAHLHIAVWSPWLDHAILRCWWGQAVRATGRDCPYLTRDEVMSGRHDQRSGITGVQLGRRDVALYSRRGVHGRPLPVIPWPASFDIRAMRGASELCKYVIKDAVRVEGGELLYDVKALASLYEAVDGRRAQSATLGLWQWCDAVHGTASLTECLCPACGEGGGALRVYVTPLFARPPPRAWARGPALPRPPVHPGEEGYHPGTDPALIARAILERRLRERPPGQVYPRQGAPAPIL